MTLVVFNLYFIVFPLSIFQLRERLLSIILMTFPKPPLAKPFLPFKANIKKSTPERSCGAAAWCAWRKISNARARVPEVLEDICMKLELALGNVFLKSWLLSVSCIGSKE